MALPALTGNRLKGNQDMQTKMLKVTVAKPTPIDHLDLQIDTFCKTIAMTTIKVVQNRLQPVGECPDECLKRFKTSGFYSSHPVLQGCFGCLTISMLVEPMPKACLQLVTPLQFR